ncbi:Nucleoside-diphosphate-sugar epimerase [Roseovarius nanhaiticus]|uniref:Nucleoside-diphosphate-sugar epimerase n=1 Tax=Roseovarius nanhaiticus TaxID=573024 RepID=A0A1N7EPN2_9RHOB|nr:SDR family oxidoreductase [Roseovarius nanhaiticus]SEK69870.1 Nucleoside-diphosphate-sugar epimerase [Roseovarius nanhaiticus]SIR90002.1 Nucleoside-diphosphate-sugar epimerase [Roseovarius nanhaiticus]
MGNRTLLIGASGRVGRMVLKALRANETRGCAVSAQYKTADSAMRDGDLIWNLSDGFGPLRAWMCKHGTPSCMTVLAGRTPITGDALEVNVSIAGAYLRAAHDCGIPRVLLASSSAVYGVGQGTPMREDHPCHPNSFYGAYKLMMEDVAAEYRAAGLEVCCLRIGNVVGADALPLGAHSGSAMGRLAIDCFDNGHGPQRSYMGPASLASTLSQLSTYPGRLPFVLNVAAPEPIHMDTLAEAAGLRWTAMPAAGYTPQRIVLDCTRLAGLVAVPSDAGSAARLISEWRAYG